MANAYTSILFNKPPLVVGQAITESRKEEVRLLLEGVRDGKPQKVVLNTKGKAKTRDEVLGVKNQIPTKLLTSLVEDETVVKSNGTMQTIYDPLAGRTFIVERLDDGRILALTGEGAPALLHEENLIRERYGQRLEGGDPLRTALPDHEIAVGDRLPRFAEALKERLTAKNPYAEVKGEEAWLKDIVQAGETKIGVIGFTATFSQVGSPAAITIKIDGALHVRASDGAPMKIELEGPIRAIDGKPNSLGLRNLKGSGRLISKVEFTHEKPALPPIATTP